jgi:adenylylsulfate kinase
VTWIVWLTGPPASGKTTIARTILGRLAEDGRSAIWLESDALRTILTPEADYSPAERDRFYATVADLAAVLAGQGFDVLVDATAPRRAHRQRLRDRFPGLLEVLVDAPAEVRETRDPKGLYRRARAGEAPHLPGATEPYEAPLFPALALSGTAPPAENARRILELVSGEAARSPD